MRNFLIFVAGFIFMANLQAKGQILAFNSPHNGYSQLRIHLEGGMHYRAHIDHAFF